MGRMHLRCLGEDRLGQIHDSGLPGLIRKPYNTREDLDQDVFRALGFSAPFLSFINHIRENGDFDSTAIVATGDQFQSHFRESVDDEGRMNWGKSLAAMQPDILKDSGFSLDLRGVDRGWHSVLTCADETFSMIGALLPENTSLNANQQRALLKKLGHQKFGEDIRYDSTEMELISGFRPGRVSMFLGDDVRDKFASIILDKSYGSEERQGDEYVLYTVHSSFFFICKKLDLLNWLQSDDARMAFQTENQDPLRIDKFLFGAKSADLEKLAEACGQNLQTFIRAMRNEIPEEVPEESRPQALLNRLKRKGEHHARHLNFNVNEVKQAIGDAL